MHVGEDKRIISQIVRGHRPYRSPERAFAASAGQHESGYATRQPVCHQSIIAPVTQNADPAGLIARELDVLRLLAQGLTDAQIAETLTVSVRTVNAHLRSIFSKLDVTNRTAAARYAVDFKLL